MKGPILKEWPPAQELFYPLDGESYEALKSSIHTDGLRMPLAAMPDGRVVDGYHRWRACKELGIEPAVFVLEGVTNEQALDYAARMNRAHRQMSPDQIKEMHDCDVERAADMRALGAEVKNIAAQLGRSQWWIYKYIGGDGSNCTSTNASVERPDSRVTVPRSAWPTIVQRLSNGEPARELAAHYGVTERRIGQIRRAALAAGQVPEDMGAPPLPTGKYRCLVIDPPWPVQKIERLERPDQTKNVPYRTMSLEEIEALPIPSLLADTAQVYLWTTQKLLPEALRLFESWGITYHCLITWVKPSGVTPFSWMFNAEHALCGYVKRLNIQRKGLKLAFSAPVSEHSAKPPEFFEAVEQVSLRPRLSMFERGERPGFAVWGNEV